MNKILKIFVVLSVFIFIVGCSDPEKEEQLSDEITEKDIFKPNIITSFTTDIAEPEPAISKEDYKKYNEIMDYLNKYPDREVDVFKEVESVYGESSDEL